MTKVKLSKEESGMVTDAGLILTKNRIIQKVYDLFGDVSDAYRKMPVPLPPEVTSIAPKIARGENYLGLPWVMLDYPRSFSHDDVFAIRSFFWWGNYFSIALLLQGIYKSQFRQSLESYLQQHPEEWLICTGTDPWKHQIDSDYTGYHSSISFAGFPFIKIAKKIPLRQWDNSFEFFTGTYRGITSALSPQAMK